MRGVWGEACLGGSVFLGGREAVRGEGVRVERER